MKNGKGHRFWEVPFGEIAKLTLRPVGVQPGVNYRTLGVKWWGEGAYERETIDGSQTAAKSLFEVREHDLIINKIWVRHGSVAVVGPEVSGCTGSNEFPTFALDHSRVHPRWVHWYTKTVELWRKCDALSQGTSGKNRIRPERFLDIQIPLPSLSEQSRLVQKIERLAAKVGEAKALRTECVKERNLIPSVKTTSIFDALSRFPDRAIRSLGVDGTNPIQTGPFGAQLHKSEFMADGIPVLNVGNVWPEGLKLDRLDHVTPDKASSLSRYRVCTDDLLFARSGATLGKVCVVPKECNGWLMTGHLFRVRFDQEQCDPHFAFMALRYAKNVRDQVFDQVRGATRPGFNTKLLGNVRLAIPPLEEQRRIIDSLNSLQSKLDRLKQLQQDTQNNLDALLPSILDRAFKGEL